MNQAKNVLGIGQQWQTVVKPLPANECLGIPSHHWFPWTLEYGSWRVLQTPKLENCWWPAQDGTYRNSNVFRCLPKRPSEMDGLSNSATQLLCQPIETLLVDANTVFQQLVQLGWCQLVASNSVSILLSSQLVVSTKNSPLVAALLAMTNRPFYYGFPSGFPVVKFLVILQLEFTKRYQHCLPV